MTGTRNPKYRRLTLDALRRRIDAVEAGAVESGTGASGGPGAGKTGERPARRPLAIAALDAALNGGLPRAALHDIRPAEHGDGPAATAFALALLRQLTGPGPVLWCLPRHGMTDFGRPYGPGLMALGLPPERLLLVCVRTDTDVLQAMEEGLRARALAAVIGEAEKVDLTASRRLSLAAAEGATPCLLLRPHKAETVSAAHTRWRIAALPGLPDALDANAPGSPRWLAALERCRNGRPGQWPLDWNHETHRFHLAAPLAGRPAAPESAPGEIVPLRRTA